MPGAGGGPWCGAKLARSITGRSGAYGSGCGGPGGASTPIGGGCVGGLRTCGPPGGGNSASPPGSGCAIPPDCDSRGTAVGALGPTGYGVGMFALLLNAPATGAFAGYGVTMF